MTLTDQEVVLGEFGSVNGDHLMTPADDEYCRRAFCVLADTPALTAAAAHAHMRAGRIPLPSYVLTDGSFIVYPDYHAVIEEAGGPECVRDWFLGHWASSDQETAVREWEAYQSGQYVCLRSVTPETIRAKSDITMKITDLTALLDADPTNENARDDLVGAVDELDELETPFTGYDRRRFGGPTSREALIDAVRGKYLADHDAYRMTVSLNVLNHLGINLYSNLPAVLSEAVANAWDADATHVDIKIDPSAETIVITDDGIGMTRRDINQRYLNVGYTRREDERNIVGARTLAGRPVMGRKGIGKLSLFSIAERIEVQSVARRPLGDPDGPIEHSALVLDLAGIRSQISGSDGNGVYTPEHANLDPTLTTPGTRLTLTQPRKDLRRTAAHLRRRLARRFSMLASDFEITVDGDPISPEDRDLAKRCRYLWVFGPTAYQERILALVQTAERIQKHSGVTSGGRQVSGWIGSAKTSTDLKPDDEGDETLNRIAVLTRGKLAQEDVLEGVAQGGMFTKFLSGELYADFLDEDGREDIATSSRQGIVEDDERFVDFRAFLTERIASIGTDWNKFREEDGAADATKLVPAIEDWLKGFKGDTRKQATRFVARVNSIAADDNQRRQLLGSAVIAFERLRRQERISEINATDDANLPALIAAFKSIDDVEAAMYYDIVQQRLEIIRKFENLTDDNVLENVLRDYLFEHLWLLDPGWDRATEAHMEKTIAKLLSDKKAPKDRVDIKYCKTGGEHVIVELKRAGRAVSTAELLSQTEKYRPKVLKALRQSAGADVDVQIVCVVGKDLSDWADDGGRERSRKSLEPYNTRVVMYQELVENALQAYQAYLDANREVGAVRDILHAMETQIGSEATPATSTSDAHTASTPGDGS